MIRTGKWAVTVQTACMPVFIFLVTVFLTGAAARANVLSFHDTDYYPPDRAISLSELLRIIQFYNSTGLHCDAGGEDGFAPGSGDASCNPHDGDYYPRDWRIGLSELLRIIQFFNSGGYHFACGTEDGFAPGSGEDCIEGEGEEEGVLAEGEPEGLPTEGAIEGELQEGEGGNEGGSEGEQEGEMEGAETIEGEPEGFAVDGELEGDFEEGVHEGLIEGTIEGMPEGLGEGAPSEGLLEGEGTEEGTLEGFLEEEGILEGQAEGLMEGEGAEEGAMEGLMEGEGVEEGSIEGLPEGEGALEGDSEGMPEGEGSLEGAAEGEGSDEGEGQAECPPESPPYPIGHLTRDYTDTSRGVSVRAEIYYPALYSGDNVPMAEPACRTFPVIIFGHGYQTPIGNYNYLWENFVPNGYFMVLCDTQNSVVWNFGDFGRDLAFLVSAFQGEGTDPASVFFNRVAPSTAVLGHSMGGGATVMSPKYTANITTTIGLAPSAIDSAVLDAAALVQVPSLIIAAGHDCIVPAGSHAHPIYNAIPFPCKYYAEIKDGSHCEFAQDADVCKVAQSIACLFFDDFVNDNFQRSMVIQFSLPWLDVMLKGRNDAFQTFLTNLAQNASTGAITYTGACGK